MRARGGIAAGALALGLLAAAAPAAARPVVSYPGPGWRAASAHTGITFAGARAAALGAVRVTGSRSGRHPGALQPLRSRRGAVFTPDAPFEAGERVEVRVHAPVAGAPSGRFAFRVARPGPPVPAAVEDDGTAAPARAPAGHAAATGRGVRRCRLRWPHFHTQPRFHPVGMCLTHRADRRAARGELLVTPKTHPRAQQALEMVSNQGQLLWYAPRDGYVRDLKVVRYRGRRRLAFFEDRPGNRAFYALMNHRYRVVRRIRPGNGLRMNMHDLQLTPRGTAYLAAYNPVIDPRTRTPVVDYVLQEVDIRSRQVLFEWHALDHVPLWASYKSRPRGRVPWDYFHGNSIELPRPHRRTIVVSARNTSAAYGISRRTGAVRWTLGGRQDDFGVVAHHPEWQFCAQHDVRRLPGGEFSVFDNGGRGRGLDPGACPRHPARVERFRLRGRTARLVDSISSRSCSESRAGYLPPGLGSARLQDNGDMLVNWGSAARVTEVTPAGDVDFGLRLAQQSYRAVRVRWNGHPPGRPAVVARRRPSGAVAVWVSWNGATDVRRWQVLAGRRSHLAPVGEPVPFAGLETRLRVRTEARELRVRALGRRDRVLGRSRAVRIPRP